eukprot:12216446-Ditylum_brightwellii.AAC.1
MAVDKLKGTYQEMPGAWVLHRMTHHIFICIENMEETVLNENLSNTINSFGSDKACTYWVLVLSGKSSPEEWAVIPCLYLHTQ